MLISAVSTDPRHIRVPRPAPSGPSLTISRPRRNPRYTAAPFTRDRFVPDLAFRW
jgi:hypothetical protein